MNTPQYIPSFYFSKFAQGISEPYTSLQAYRGGAIDQNGNILKSESSLDPLEYLIIKLKKIFEELPMGMTKSKLNNYMSTLQLFGEEAVKLGLRKGEYVGLVEGKLALAGYPEISLIHLVEDMGAGGMAAAGSSPGYNQGQVSGMDPVMAPMQKRTKPVATGLDACEMFDVCPEEIQQFKAASDWKYVEEGPTKKYLRRYQLRNPNGTIALRSVDPDTGKADVHWISFKPKKLKEQAINQKNLISENKKAATRAYQDSAKNRNNVAVLDNDQEEKYKPVEVNQRNIDDVVQGAIEAVGKQTTKAGVSEKQINLQDTIRSVSPLLRVAKSGSAGEESAAKVLGLMRYLGGRSVSSPDPYDTARAVIDPTAQSGMGVVLRDVKTKTATAQVQTRKSEVEFPLVNGMRADEAVRELKKSGRDEPERRRITDEIIKPFINRPEIRAAFGRDLLRFQQEKGRRSQELLDPNQAIMGQMAVSLAREPWAEPVDVDMSTFARDLESSEWRFGVKKGGAQSPSFTPTVSGGKFSAYRGYDTPSRPFELDPAILTNLNAQTVKSVKDYFARLRG